MKSRKSNKFTEFDLLDFYYQTMLDNGSTRNLIRYSIDHRLVEKIYEKRSISLSESELQKIADICLANNWLEYTSIAGKYGNLCLSTTGLGIATSKRRQKEVEASKGLLKKFSGFIEEHKGLFILLGFVIALIGLIIKFTGVGFK